MQMVLLKPHLSLIFKTQTPFMVIKEYRINIYPIQIVYYCNTTFLKTHSILTRVVDPDPFVDSDPAFQFDRIRLLDTDPETCC